MSNNPLLQIALRRKSKSFGFAFLVTFLNFLAALIEGLSFSMILLAFTALSGEYFSLPYFSGLNTFPKAHLFSFFIVASIGLQCLRSLFAYLGQIINVRFATFLQTEGQKRVFDQIFRLSFRSVSQYKVGDLVDYANAPTQYVMQVMDGLKRSDRGTSPV